MSRLFVKCYQKPFGVLAVFAVGAALALWQGAGLRLELGSAPFIEQGAAPDGGEPARLSILAGGPGLYTPGGLRALRQLDAELGMLEGTGAVDSLARTPVPRRLADGSFTAAPLLHTAPGTPEAAAAVRTAALGSAIARGSLAGPDGETALIHAEVAPGTAGNTAALLELHRGVEALLERHRGSFGTLFQAGGPAVTAALHERLVREAATLLPLGGLLIFGVLAVALRSLRLPAMSLIASGVAALLTAGLTAALGIPVTLLNFAVPLIVFIAGASADVHVFCQLQAARHVASHGPAAAHRTIRVLAPALLLAGATTFLGFLANAAAGLPGVREFAVASAAGVAVRLLVTFTLLPSLVRLSGADRVRPAGAGRGEGLGGAVWQALERGPLAHPRLTLALFAAVAGACLVASSGMHPSSDAATYLPGDPDFRAEAGRLAEATRPADAFTVRVRGEPGTFRTRAGLAALAELRARLAAWQPVRFVEGVDRHAAVISEAWTGRAGLPAGDRAAALTLELMPRRQRAELLSADAGTASLRVHFAPDADAAGLAARVEGMRGLPEPLAGLEATGTRVALAREVDALARGQVSALGATTAALLLICGVLFLSARCAAVAVLANLAPVVAVFGLMALAGVPLDAGTALVASVALGLAVDDTLHLMVRYNQRLRRTRDERKALAQTVRDQARPVAVTTAALVAGFGVLGLSSFEPVAHFGLFSAAALALALAADLCLTPLMLARMRLITLWDYLALPMRRRLLEQSPIFAGMNYWQARKVVLSSELHNYFDGDPLARAGEMSATLFILIDGEADVSRQINGQDLVISRLRAGDFFGDAALVAPIPRTADVRARGHARAIELDWSSLQTLQRDAPYTSSRFLLNLARILGDRLGDALIKAGMSPPPPAREGEAAPAPAGGAGG